MVEWKIDLLTTHFKNKAEKFSEEDTKKSLALLLEMGWDKKIMNS